VVVGTGKRLFGEGTSPGSLRLVDTQQTATGAVLHVYERAGGLKYGEAEVGQETVIFLRPDPRELSRRWISQLLAMIAFLVAIEGAWSAESRSSLVSNGLELGNVTATSDRESPNLRRISFQFTLRNVGITKVTVLTRNLQSELWDYEDPPKELHITISALPVRNGQQVHPPLAHFSPVNLKPGESVELKQDYLDRKGIGDVVLVYDMLNSTAEKYGTWRGRIKSSVVSVSAEGH
jgi:hypothetical protein